MISAIIIGRGGSKGLPGKNKTAINNIPLMIYPIKAAMNCKEIDKVFFSSEDKELRALADIHTNLEIELINRPKALSTDEAIADDVFKHAKKYITKKYGEQEALVLMFANAVGITSVMLTEMIEIYKSKNVDSICTVSQYQEFSPFRVRKISSGLLYPYVNNMDWEGTNSNRDSFEKSYIYDCSAAVINPNNLTKEMQEISKPPQLWLGQYILPYGKYRDIPCLDIDFFWQIPQMKMWLKKYWID